MDWALPYAATREPVLGNAVVATSQPLAAQAGLDVLAGGGNAVDAALAAAMTLTVVEPAANGIGGDLFAIVWRDGALHGLNASGRSPRDLDVSAYDGLSEIPSLGWLPVTVPGAVSGWAALAERFATRPLTDLARDAIRHATDGYPVGPQTAAGWARAAERYAGMTDWEQTFLIDGRPPAPGERFRAPDHAATLDAIARSRGDAFYRGALADRIAEAGWLTREDLATHTPEWTAPLSVPYRDLVVHELPPNGQGLAALIALGLLERLPMASSGPDDPLTLHRQIEAMKIAFADARAVVCEPDCAPFPPADLLAPARLDARAAEITDRAADPGHVPPVYSSTVYLAAADADGTMVSLIQSNFEGFGSGVVVPGTGIALHNRGRGFVLDPTHPNAVGPGKRPFHTIIPGFVTRDGQPLMAFGVMGGPMQPQGHLQVVCRIADHDANPQAALDAPRWRLGEGRTVDVEPGIPPATLDDLAARGHQIQIADRRSVRFGGGQAVLRLPSGCYLGASDARREGQAVAR